MRRNQKGLKKRGLPFYILKTLIFIVLSIISITVGAIGGDFLLKIDSKLVRDIDAENFKTILNKSFPVISTIYNSGNINISISSEIKNLVNSILNIDLENPLTILNANSSLFSNYYNKEYKVLIAQREKKTKETDIPEVEFIKEENSQMKQAASSISSEDIKETREIKDDAIISNENGKIKIQNETNYKINIDDLLKQPLNIKFDKKGPKALIYHTHTTEGYLKNLDGLYKSISVRTNDPIYNVVRAGDELSQNLRKKFGIEVIHNGTVHNYPSDVGAYARSLNTVNKILKSYPSIKLALDIHRDGMSDDEKLRVVTKLNNKNAAQIMFVIGTDATGLNHPNWRENLKLAIKLQEKLNEISPGLAKPIYISKNRYNQHVSKGALIIEIGGDGNLMSEALESTKYISKAIDEIANNK